MPVTKFRSVEEMSGLPPPAPRDPDNLRVACAWSRFLAELRPWRAKPGVHKHHSIDEAAKERARWEASAPAPEGAKL